jgi:hypothetical protein
MSAVDKSKANQADTHLSTMIKLDMEVFGNDLKSSEEPVGAR